MSDLSFNIVALDKASSTFLKIADRLDKVSEKIDKLDGKDATVNVNVETDQSSKALDSFDTRFKLMAAGIIAASPAAGAAVIAGIGGGFIATAVLAQKSNQDVQQAYTGMWRNVVNQTKGATAQLVPQIVGAADAINAEMQRLGPQMSQAFSYGGPAIVALTRGVTDFAHNAMPGATAAMANSLPVFSGLANAAGTLGTAIGTSLQSASQHSAEYGIVIGSLGSITGTVITGAVAIVNDLGIAWAQNATEINASVEGVITTVTGLANGVLPVLVFALDAAVTTIHAVTEVLGPLAPILGTIAGVALTTWAAFKLAGLVTVGVRALGLAVVGLAGNMEAGATKSAVMIAAMRGVSVQASATAVAVKAAGAGAATAGLGFGTAASAIAGPLGIALIAGTLLMTAFAGSEDDTKVSTDDLKATIDGLTSAFESSKGAINASVIDNLQHSESFKKIAEATNEFGISQTDLSTAITAGGPTLDALRARLAFVGDVNARLAEDSGKSGSEIAKQAKTARDTATALDALIAGLGSSQTSAAKNTAAIKENANALVASNAGQSAAGRISRTLGIELDGVTTGFQGVAQSSGDASTSVYDVAANFIKASIGIAQANQAIQSRFVTADKAVATARTGVSDASKSYQQSIVSVKDAQHSYAQASAAVATAQQGVADAQRGVTTANRSLEDAYRGVTTAQQAHTKAQQDELKAQLAVNDAREQALEDLKAIHLQLEDQTVTEESARVRLFESQQNAANFGITDKNAKDIAKAPVTFANIDQIKTALELLSAQNQLNNALNTGENLRVDVTRADALGVEKARGVVSAQDALRGAQDQVASSAEGITKAQQQVEEASYGLQQAQRGLTRAHQGVSDAAYNEQKAHQAVSDAQDQSTRAAGNLQRAKETLTEAEGASSRSLDLNTKAGLDNLNLLMQLWGVINATGMTTQEKYNSLVSNTATAFGMSKQAAADYLTQLGLIPADFKFGVTAVASVDANNLWNDVTSPARPTGRAMMFADGGHARGPGGPRGDKIPALLSDNEYVQPAHIVDYYGVGFMEDVRNKKVPKGYANGGLVSANYGLADLGARYQSGVGALSALGLKHPPGLPKYVAPPVSYGGGGLGGALPIGQHLALIDQALAFVGIPKDQWPRWESGLNTLITRESGWNPNIVNMWDSNAKAGHPSGGLMQTIASTFAGNRDPRLPNNMFDPLANVVAGINYINRRYGGIGNVQQANASASAKGYVDGGLVKSKIYDAGGWLNPGDHGQNSGSQREAVLTPRESEAYVAHAKATAAPKPTASDGPNHFTGNLYLDTGALVGVVKGVLRKVEDASGMFS
jgi:SLT domain-containing protein